ncbi:MAG: hypothetical protein ACETWR_00660 [Anaerolineae bacterium]
MQIAIILLLTVTALLIVYSGLLIAGVSASPTVDAIQTIAGGSITLVVALMGYTLKSLDSRLAAIDKELRDVSSRLGAVEGALDVIKATIGPKK